MIVIDGLFLKKKQQIFYIFLEKTSRVYLKNVAGIMRMISSQSKLSAPFETTIVPKY